MMTMIDQYEIMKRDAWSGIWAKRILSELQYLIEVSRSRDGRYDALLASAVSALYESYEENKVITKEMALKTEEELTSLEGEARSITVLLIAHAHIDMNWMWGFNETVSLAISTFETMLQLMREYPQFTFSQSQASVYRIVEEYAPYLLPEIRQRIREGRWEVTASTWVENDKNMSGTEAMMRHILYTKNYLSKLLEIDPDSLNIDFEPDTFGHTENMPEIMAQGGVKYYYHCRGYHKEHVYRWRAPSGAEAIVYREPVWYNDEIAAYDSLGYVPSFCRTYGITKTMKFYGVGDHGGGPSRAEVEHWLEMQKWPLMPEIRFGSLHEFFAYLEECRDRLPVVQQELNYIFPGCYTTQARIKRANKMGEERLEEAEVLSAMGRSLVEDYRAASDFEKGWRNILFNQFHDILPGSGVWDTYQYAQGKFQETLAGAQVNMTHAMKTINENIDTSVFHADGTDDPSLGAGVGFGTGDQEGYLNGFTSFSLGRERIVTIYNPTQYLRKEPARVLIWDWQMDPEQMAAYDAEGNEVPLQILRKNVAYWAHRYHEVLIEAEVPSFGYNSYVLKKKSPEHLTVNWEMFSTSGGRDPRNDDYSDAPIVLENDRIRAVFEAPTMMILSLTDKEDGKEYISSPSGDFRFILENPVNEMTAWRIGAYQKVYSVNQQNGVRITETVRGELCSFIAYELEFENSTVQVRVSLQKGSSALHYRVKTQWHELGSKTRGIPQLQFSLPLGYKSDTYRCSVPGGIIDRKEFAQDVPCLGYMNALSGSEKSVCLMSDCKYGFRGYQDSISLTLLRSPYDPDPTPDQGEHNFCFAVSLVSDKEDLTEKYEGMIHPLYSCSNSSHEGKLPVMGSFIRICGKVKATTLYEASDQTGYILRLQNLEKEDSRVEVTVEREIKKAAFTNVLEEDLEDIPCEKNTFTCIVPRGSIRTVKIII